SLFQLKSTAKFLQRQAKKAAKDEVAEKAKLKKALAQGNTEGARIYASNAIRKKNESLNLLRLGSRIDAVSSRVETAVTMRQVTGSMTSVVKGMDRAMESMNLDRIALARVTKLIHENGAVTGVEYIVNGQTLKEFGPVILATGGYAADFDEGEGGLLKKYRPELLKLSTTNGDHCTGDGQKMIAAIGGKLIDLEKVQVHPTGLVDPKDPDAKVKFFITSCPRCAGGV
ncbi:unnamed protein product, partial [Tilletia caries]